MPHHHVEPSEQLYSFLDSRLDLLLLAHVGLHSICFDVRVPFRQERESLLGGVDIDVHEEDIGTLLREEERRLEADATEMTIKSELVPRKRKNDGTNQARTSQHL